MKRILIFIGLKIAELSLAVLLFFAGYYFIDFVFGNELIFPWYIQSFLGAGLLFTICVVIWFVLYLFAVGLLSLIKSNWRKAGEIEKKLRRK